MGRVYDIFDKFSIISIIIGLLLGLFLAINHNDSNVWVNAIPFIFIFALIMTFMPTFAAILAKITNDEKFSFFEIFEAFLLNLAMIGVCTAFGLVIGSFIFGSLVPDNGVIFR